MTSELGEALGTTFGLVVGIIALFIAACAIVMPVAVLMIHTQIVKQTKLLQQLLDAESTLHHTRLLTEIRNALQSMQAVGVVEEEPLEPQHALPRINNPSSVPPAKERLRY